MGVITVRGFIYEIRRPAFRIWDCDEASKLRAAYPPARNPLYFWINLILGTAMGGGSHDQFTSQLGTRQIPAGQGCANRRHCHFMRRQLEYVVDTSQLGHSLGGHFQAGDRIITIGTFLQRFSKKIVKTGSPNRPALSLNLTFRGICKNHDFKVSIASSVCHGFIYSRQKSIIFRTY